ncbi:MAG: hypothetical protein ACO3F9_06305, partial [Burkholderiales bacterium]
DRPVDPAERRAVDRRPGIGRHGCAGEHHDDFSVDPGRVEDDLDRRRVVDERVLQVDAEPPELVFAVATSVAD